MARLGKVRVKPVDLGGAHRKADERAVIAHREISKPARPIDGRKPRDERLNGEDVVFGERVDAADDVEKGRPDDRIVDVGFLDPERALELRTEKPPARRRHRPAIGLEVPEADVLRCERGVAEHRAPRFGMKPLESEERFHKLGFQIRWGEIQVKAF